MMQAPSSHDINARIDSLCKPPGSLGELESIARKLCAIQGTLSPSVSPRRVVVFAADHGVTSEGVTAWPSEVTGLVTRVMQSGRTASGVFAEHLHCEYEVVDVGLRARLPASRIPGSAVQFIDAAGRRGTGNLRFAAAMTGEEFDHAWAVGSARADAANDDGCRLVIGGEMGIGNTTAASCLASLLAGVDVQDAVGRGAGLNDIGLAKKVRVVEDAIARVRALEPLDAQQIGCEVGGLEIVALSGFYARAAALGLVIILDGYIATSAALLADAIHPQTKLNMIAGHRSAEPGHQAALQQLWLSPVLDLGCRLGEGTGALAALPLVDLAAAMINGMATLAELESP
ncbi:nicotinate-nucleotide--dimethylbenzimidazole phosphoribosyltransferase [Allorhodopirellula heiligendammensis]|uniref:Nicotinate-nucleotide--dimethylbenzimidazole phosphoribosyltransferase n=1 Tax=Allorhodopirellula heiligendammensis TaxID=2714739 RepID=A0A5C6BX86_9BACT|nr:nicotinate-nucleotide--dimethylbenzimidazole phosphoribosyltransferase [Allorhodopirellula heiligendammensis]TWU15289.1 Nicotinate-nucleotide--dimethylbenzimidazole phosphoribosyltransferase [Allorhodopirellula heiligendammensis]